MVSGKLHASRRQTKHRIQPYISGPCSMNVLGRSLPGSFCFPLYWTFAWVSEPCELCWDKINESSSAHKLKHWGNVWTWSCDATSSFIQTSKESVLLWNRFIWLRFMSLTVERQSFQVKNWLSLVEKWYKTESIYSVEGTVSTKAS